MTNKKTIPHPLSNQAELAEIISKGTLVLAKMFDKLELVKDESRLKQAVENVEILLTINNLAEKMVWNVLFLQKQMDKLGSENMVLAAEIVRLKKELEFTEND
jgi:hypothetical protein